MNRLDQLKRRPLPALFFGGDSRIYNWQLGNPRETDAIPLALNKFLYVQFFFILFVFAWGRSGASTSFLYGIFRMGGYHIFIVCGMLLIFSVVLISRQ
jgi:polyferredoxin